MWVTSFIHLLSIKELGGDTEYAYVSSYFYCFLLKFPHGNGFCTFYHNNLRKLLKLQIQRSYSQRL